MVSSTKRHRGRPVVLDDSDGETKVLLRVPMPVKRALAESAQAKGITLSQEATFAILFSACVHGAVSAKAIARLSEEATVA